MCKLDVSADIVRADATTWLNDMPPNSAQVIVLDPPYRGPTDAPVRGRDDGAGGQVFGLFGFLHDLFDAAYQTLKTGGIAIVFCDFKRTPDVGRIAGMAGLRLNTCIAWDYNRVGTGGLNAWSPILIFSKGAAKSINKDAVPNTIHCEPIHHSKRVHVYQKPEQVYSHILKRVIQSGDVALDPFAGSGSSKKPSEDLGAVWKGCDIAIQRKKNIKVS